MCSISGKAQKKGFGNGVYWELTDGTLTISGSGIVPEPNSPLRQITMFSHFSLSMFSANLTVSVMLFVVYLYSILITYNNYISKITHIQ